MVRTAIPPVPDDGKGGRSVARRATGTRTRDRGAVAVEFALLLPVLLMLVFGLIDFGRLLNAQITLTQAAREGARLAALGYPSATVVSRTVGAATGLNLSSSNVTATICPSGAGPGTDGTVQVTYHFSFVTPIGAIVGFGSSNTLTTKAVMPCET